MHEPDVQGGSLIVHANAGDTPELQSDVWAHRTYFERNNAFYFIYFVEVKAQEQEFKPLRSLGENWRRVTTRVGRPQQTAHARRSSCDICLLPLEKQLTHHISSPSSSNTSQFKPDR